MPVSSRSAAEAAQSTEIVETPVPAAPHSSLKRGWATPVEVKGDLVDEMIRIVQDPDIKTKDRVAAFNALRVADQSQWERDHPVESGKSKGGVSAPVNIQINMAAAAALRGAIERGELGIIEELSAPDQPSTPGNS